MLLSRCGKPFSEADQDVFEVSAPAAAVDLDDPPHGSHHIGHVIQGDVLRDGLSLLGALEETARAISERGEDFGGREFSPHVAGKASLDGDLVPHGDKELLKSLCGRCGECLTGDIEEAAVEPIEDRADQMVFGGEVAIESGRADAGGARDVIEVRGAACLREDPLSGRDDPRSVLGGVAARWR
jgi:hypothetical protein